jgi:hypothetical protein
VIYAGDSAADELAISRLKGVAHTFRVINEDSTVITKTVADYRLEGELLNPVLEIKLFSNGSVIPDLARSSKTQK